MLVCDVGGGTTDFSLIAVTEEAGELVLTRVAVGDHILLGGDNMDLALARPPTPRSRRARTISSTRGRCSALAQLPARQGDALSEPASCHSPGDGARPRQRRSSAARSRASWPRDDVDKVLVDGFFPDVSQRRSPRGRRSARPAGDRPALRGRPSHHQAPRALSVGASSQQSRVGRGIRRGRSGLACPAHILFNGGVMKAAVLRDRVVEVLNNWLRQEGLDALKAEQILEAPDLEHAVARKESGLLRQGASRSRSAYPQWRFTDLLHRNRKRHACRAWHGSSAQGALRRSLWHGGGHRGHDSRQRVWPRSW